MKAEPRSGVFQPHPLKPTRCLIVLHRSAIRLEMLRLPLRSPAGCPAAQRRDGPRLPQCDRRRGTRHAPRRGLGPAPRCCGPPAVGGVPSKGSAGLVEVGSGDRTQSTACGRPDGCRCFMCIVCIELVVGMSLSTGRLENVGRKKILMENLRTRNLTTHFFHFIDIFTKYFFFHMDFHIFLRFAPEFGKNLRKLMKLFDFF